MYGYIAGGLHCLMTLHFIPCTCLHTIHPSIFNDSALKDTLPKLSDGSKISTPVSKAIAQVESAIKALPEGGDASKLQADLSTLRSAAVASVDAQISELSEVSDLQW